MSDFPPRLTVEDAARRLGLSRDTVRRLIRRGDLPAVRLRGSHGQFRIAEADLVLAFQPARPRDDAMPERKDY